MWLTVQKFTTEVEEIVTLLEKSVLILDETGPVDNILFSLCFQKHDGCSSCYRVPVVLMRDLCEDG